jgi:hypothetical protein
MDEKNEYGTLEEVCARIEREEMLASRGLMERVPGFQEKLSDIMEADEQEQIRREAEMKELAYDSESSREEDLNEVIPVGGTTPAAMAVYPKRKNGAPGGKVERKRRAVKTTKVATGLERRKEIDEKKQLRDVKNVQKEGRAMKRKGVVRSIDSYFK